MTLINPGLILQQPPRNGYLITVPVIKIISVNNPKNRAFIENVLVVIASHQSVLIMSLLRAIVNSDTPTGSGVIGRHTREKTYYISNLRFEGRSAIVNIEATAKAGEECASYLQRQIHWHTNTSNL